MPTEQQRLDGDRAIRESEISFTPQILYDAYMASFPITHKILPYEEIAQVYKDAWVAVVKAAVKGIKL